MFSEEDFGITIMWIVLAQLGVKIDFIQDNKTVNFSVPSLSDYTAQNQDMPLIGNSPKGEPIAGELLLNIANSFFIDNGFTPNGRVRSEYWTIQMGEVASAKMQQEMNQ